MANDSPALVDAFKNKRVMTDLIRSEGWEVFDAIQKEREENLLADFLNVNAEYSDTKLREFRIGLNLIRTIRMTPAIMIEESKELIDQLYVEDEEQEDGTGTGSEEGSGSGHPDS